MKYWLTLPRWIPIRGLYMAGYEGRDQHIHSNRKELKNGIETVMCEVAFSIRTSGFVSRRVVGNVHSETLREWLS
jgi:hypothetical protein